MLDKMFYDEDFELIRELRREKDIDVVELLNKKDLSEFELDLLMNGA